VSLSGAAVGNLALDALGNELAGVGDVGLEVAVLGALLHRAQGPHAAVGLVGTTLEQNDFAGTFVGAREERAEHDRGGTCGQGLGKVAAVLDATIGDQADAGLLGGRSASQDGRKLGVTHARNHACGADGAGADTDLHNVGACFGEGGDRLGSDHVACHDGNRREATL
jgi:hypothetical protein